MDFDELQARYLTLRGQLDRGEIAPAEFQRRMAELRFRTAQGQWWQIDPATGGWLVWNGRAWAPAPAPPAVTDQQMPAQQVRRGRRPPPVPEPTPQTLWQLIILVVKGWVANLPLTIVTSLLMAGATWVFHTWLVVAPNNTMLYPTKPVFRYIINTVQNPRGGMAFWSVIAYFVSPFLGRLFSAPIACLKGIVLFPSWLARGFQKLRWRAAVPLLIGGIVALVLSWRMANYMLAWAYAAGFLLLTMGLDMSFEYMVLKLALSDLRRYLHLRLTPVGAESECVFLLFPGLALGFAVSALHRTPTLWARLTFWGGLAVILIASAASIAKRRKTARQAATFLVLMMFVCSCVFLLGTVLADDGTWAESGRTIQGLVRNTGWPMVRKLGLPPAEAAALAGLLTTNLGAAYAYMLKHGIDPSKLGLPDTPPPQTMKVAPQGAPLTPEQRKARVEQIRQEMARTEAEAQAANSWSGILSLAWSNWDKEAVEIGDAAVRLATSAKDVVVKGATSLYKGAKAVYNDPGLVTRPLAGFAEDVVGAVKDVWNDPGIVWDTATGTWQDVKGGVATAADVGAKVIKGVAEGVYTTLTDPGKMWDAIKDSGGWENWKKSWDPNVPVLERFENVFIATGKIGMTIATAGQARAALAAGKEILAVGGAQILKGDLKGAARTLINGVLRTGASAEAKASTAVAEKAGALKGGKLVSVHSAVPATGINPGHLKTIQEGAQKFGLDVSIRPQGPVSGFVRGGIPKPSDFKNKSINFVDRLIGAKGPEGAIGHFKPDAAATQKLIQGIKSSSLPAERKAQMIREVADRFTMRMSEVTSPKMQKLIEEGKVAVKSGTLVDVKTGRPFISDLDLFSATKAGGRPLTGAEERAFIDWCSARGVPVTHGAHINWNPATAHEYEIFEGITKGHGPGGKAVITVGSDGSVGAANYVPPAR